MKASWVAGGVRARALARRRYGAGAAASLASCGSLAEALDRLAATPYGHDVRPGMSLADAQLAVSATTLWHYRVLGGWVPSQGVQLLRVLAAGFEIANTDRLLRSFRDGRGQEDTTPAYRLGALATAWPRLERTTSVPALRGVLAVSPWGDPGDESPWAVRVGMRLSWAHRAYLMLPSRWVLGATALLVAREQLVAGHVLGPVARRTAETLLGAPALAAGTLTDFVAALPRDAAWPLAEVTDTAALWLAEAGWWKQAERDAFQQLRTSQLGPGTLLGAAALLGVDAWRVRAALEVAARGGQGREVFDAVA